MLLRIPVRLHQGCAEAVPEARFERTTWRIMREHTATAIRLYQQQQSHAQHHQTPLTPLVAAISHHERHHGDQRKQSG